MGANFADRAALNLFVAEGQTLDDTRDLDDAISESFAATLKRELGMSRYPSYQVARASVFAFIELFYNRVRRHSSLGSLSPAEYEQAILEEAAVA